MQGKPLLRKRAGRGPLESPSKKGQGKWFWTLFPIPYILHPTLRITEVPVSRVVADGPCMRSERLDRLLGRIGPGSMPAGRST
ncbi:protein of unknown function [Candidatus Methylomirabilis oxygeniifera]|uniref:Uncharacterized protein n=1 Tax=Methylomirabilis oxygeniifera TaxID=671143 RepID=D5ML97_METO1|nr:protein of unknown function [Candidatus Methylomirabilis oxyfera]